MRRANFALCDPAIRQGDAHFESIAHQSFKAPDTAGVAGSTHTLKNTQTKDLQVEHSVFHF